MQQLTKTKERTRHVSYKIQFVRYEALLQYLFEKIVGQAVVKLDWQALVDFQASRPVGDVGVEFPRR